MVVKSLLGEKYQRKISGKQSSQPHKRSKKSAVLLANRISADFSLDFSPEYRIGKFRLDLLPL